MSEDDIRVRIDEVRQRIAQASRRAGRDLEEVTVVGASKGVVPERILEAITLGIKHVGENQVQEAEAKFTNMPSLCSSATWHMIGHLQSNKVRRALELFEVIQSVDSLGLARRINSIAGELNRWAPVYIEVDVGTESTKSGVRPEGLMELAEGLAECHHLRLAGLMTVPPHLADPQAARPYFRKMRELWDALCRSGLPRYERLELSMGMSHDFEVAIEEGATMVRLGTSIWGDRLVRYRA